MRLPRFYEEWKLNKYKEYVYYDEFKQRWCIKDDAPERCKKSYDLWYEMNYNPFFDSKEFFPEYK